MADCSATAPPPSEFVEQFSGATVILDLIEQLRLAAKELKAGNFNDALIKALLSGLKENGTLLECFINACSPANDTVAFAFNVFNVFVDNKSLSLSNRIKLLELVMLRANHWMPNKSGPLMDLSNIMNRAVLKNTVSRGLQTLHTQKEVTESAVNTEAVVPKTGEATLHKHYVYGPGVELKISGCSYLLVEGIKVLLEYFFKSALFFEGLKSTAMQLNIIRPPADEIDPCSPMTDCSSPDGSSMSPCAVERHESYQVNEFDKEDILKPSPPTETSTLLGPLSDCSYDASSACQHEAQMSEPYLEGKLTETNAVGRDRRTHFLRPESTGLGENKQIEQPVASKVYEFEMDNLWWYDESVQDKGNPQEWEEIAKENPQIISPEFLNSISGELEPIGRSAGTSTPSSPSFDTSPMSQRGAEAYKSYIENKFPEITAVGRRRRTHFLRSESNVDRETHRTHFLHSESNGDAEYKQIEQPVPSNRYKYEMDHMWWYAGSVHAKEKPPGWEKIVKECPQIIRPQLLNSIGVEREPIVHSVEIPSSAFETAPMSESGAAAYKSYIESNLPTITAVGRRRRTHFLRSESNVVRDTHEMEQTLPAIMDI